MNLEPDELALYDFCVICKIALATLYHNCYINGCTQSLGKIDESIFTQVVTILDFRERVLTYALKNTVEKTLRSQQ